MKGDPSLRPLSREHLGALLAAKRLREAEDPATARAGFLEFWHGDGIRHFRIEEEVLLPAWARAAPVDRDGVHRMLDEHLSIRSAALRLEEGEGTLEELRELGRLLDDHVRFEERVLFPAVEAALSTAALSSLAAAIEAAESAGGLSV